MIGTLGVTSVREYSASMPPFPDGFVCPPAAERELDQQPQYLTVFGSSPTASGDSSSRDSFHTAPHRPSSTLTDHLIGWIEPLRLLGDSVGAEQRIRDVRQAYRRRVELLRSDGAMEDLAINEASEADFWSFVKSSFDVRKAGLVLLDSGNLRAVWKSDDGRRLGLQFLGGRMVEYVYFVRRPAAEEISRGAGRDTLDAVKAQIRAWNLTSLVYE